MATRMRRASPDANRLGKKHRFETVQMKRVRTSVAINVIIVPEQLFLLARVAVRVVCLLFIRRKERRKKVSRVCAGFFGVVDQRAGADLFLSQCAVFRGNGGRGCWRDEARIRKKKMMGKKKKTNGEVRGREGCCRLRGWKSRSLV